MFKNFRLEGENIMSKKTENVMGIENAVALTTKEGFLKTIENVFEKFEYESQEGQFPIPIGLRKAGEENFMVSGAINLVLGVNFKLFSVEKDIGERYFDGLEYLFGAQNIVTNKDTDFLRKTRIGAINTTAKASIMVRNLSNYKKAIKDIKEYVKWFSEFAFLDQEMTFQSLEKRLTFLLNFGVDYDFSKISDIDSPIVKNVGMMVFGDKIYRNISDPKKVVIKDYQMLLAPTKNNDLFNESSTNEDVVKYKTWLHQRGLKLHFKTLINLGEGFEKLNYLGKIIYPIFRKMKIIFFVTFAQKQTKLKFGEAAIPISYKTFDIELTQKDKTNPEDIEITFKPSRSLSVTVTSFYNFLRVINNDDGRNWIRNLYLNNKDNPKLSEYIENSMTLLEKTLCYGLESTEVDKIKSEEFKKDENKKGRRRRKKVETPVEAETKDGVTKIKDNDEGFEMPGDDVEDIAQDAVVENQNLANSLAEEEEAAEELSQSEQDAQEKSEPVVELEPEPAQEEEQQ